MLCVQCNRPCEKTRWCSGCKASTYCSEECQLLAWPVHKLFCTPNKEENRQSHKTLNRLITPILRTFSDAFAYYKRMTDTVYLMEARFTKRSDGRYMINLVDHYTPQSTNKEFNENEPVDAILSSHDLSIDDLHMPPQIRKSNIMISYVLDGVSRFVSTPMKESAANYRQYKKYLQGSTRVLITVKEDSEELEVLISYSDKRFSSFKFIEEDPKEQ